MSLCGAGDLVGGDEAGAEGGGGGVLCSVEAEEGELVDRAAMTRRMAAYLRRENVRFSCGSATC
jgi:hypothetical protein